MDAFETLVSALLVKDGYWTQTGFKVELTKEVKRKIGRPTSPRWEMDVIAYKGKGNHVLAIECKSYAAGTLPATAVEPTPWGGNRFCRRAPLSGEVVAEALRWGEGGGDHG